MYDLLSQFVDSIKHLRVVVVGETLHDIFVESRPLSTPQSTPYLVAEAVKDEVYLGGAFPVARDLANFVKSVTLVSNGTTSIPTNLGNFSVSGPGEIVIKKTRFTFEGKNLFFLCDWPNHQDWPYPREAFLGDIRRAIEEADIVIVFDYGHGLIDEAAARLLSGESKFLAINCQANGGTHPFNLVSKYLNPNLIALNEYEARLNLGQIRTVSQATLARSLNKQTGANFTVVTDAARGSWLCKEKSVHHQRSLCKTIVDTIGCGDTMLGFAALAACRKFDARAILYIASVAAAAKARMKVHERAINLKELEDAIATVV